MKTVNCFSVNLGLKQALETVNDYNPLMKDFPLNDLLSATELDKIRQALVAIFTHLRKIDPQLGDVCLSPPGLNLMAVNKVVIPLKTYWQSIFL